MKTMEHKYFGRLNFDIKSDIDVIWEKQIDDIDVVLWCGKDIEINEKILNKYWNFLENYQKNIKEARVALTKELNNDREYIDFHLQELEYANLPENIVGFVDKMVVTNIALWIDDNNDDGQYITMDFMILPEESDEILCVKFNINEEIVDVAWES